MKKTIIGLVVAAACGFCVSSAKATILANWINGTPPILDGSVHSASPSGSFIDSFTSTASFTFSVTLNSGYS
jgi:hypothetical protein